MQRRWAKSGKGVKQRHRQLFRLSKRKAKEMSLDELFVLCIATWDEDLDLRCLPADVRQIVDKEPS